MPTHRLHSLSQTVRRISVRCINKVKTVSFASVPMQRTGLDSHADTCCAGSNMQVLELSGEKVTVTPYSEHYDAMTDIPIATVVTVWENPKNGEAWMLVIHEALYFGTKLQESLLCPNQLRAAGNIVCDVPTQFDNTSSHSITIPGTLEIPLEMHGVISYLDTRLPTEEELEQYRAGQFQSVELTDNTPWEPYSETFATREVKARSAAAVTSPCVKKPNGLEHEAGEMMQPRRPFNLSQEERCIAVVNQLASRQDPIEFSEEEEDLPTRLIAAVNVTVQDSEGDGLYERPEDSASPIMAED